MSREEAQAGKSSEAGSLRVRGRRLDLSAPVIMGILNATPDSFSDGGLFDDTRTALGHIEYMVESGAGIIDVGGESTRPGSDPVAEQEELERVIPILEQAVSSHPDTFFSIDTTKYEVARKALEAGAHIVNDVSGLQKEPRLAGLCAEYGAGYILMHSQGDPKTMQQDPSYDDVLDDLSRFFRQQVELAHQHGLKDDQIVLDPGIGFGKTLQHNLTILGNLGRFKNLGYPLLVGASRKTMLGQILGDRPVDERLIGSVAVHYQAIHDGAKIIRVHDVKELNDAILVYKAIRQARR